MYVCVYIYIIVRNPSRRGLALQARHRSLMQLVVIMFHYVLFVVIIFHLISWTNIGALI